MLLGEYEHTIDEKNRLTLPARFRQAFSGGVVVTRGIDQCLAVYTRADWERFVSQQLSGLNPFSREARQMRRYIFSAAVETDLDRQGRVTLPAPLIKYAGLGRDVVVAGVQDHVEIWAEAAWRAQLEDVEGSAELVAERLAAKQS
ncbi:MAG TPA: division/cell wall cluster transcriptional repressor MraZ [Gaiellaceae bacterium]|nr:division/cell wall cluster transcriptional repressor MraZ [Gaiellaceae bacterium]